MDERILAVQRMQDLIEKNLYNEITLLDLSKVSLFSPWYSYRIFKEYTGLTISDYIRKLRLSKSALKLRDERTKIIDIAFEMGFKSVDGYQRAFQKEFNCNPCVIGYEWDIENPRIQLEPIGERGYIELHPIK